MTATNTLHFTEEEMPHNIKEPYLTLSCLALSLITASIFYSFN